MPLTFSHPAIILPLRFLPKSWFSLTALVVGSMAPDFEYFLRMKSKSDYSHTLSGIFWFDLPLALLLSFLFHNVIRNFLLQNLPKFIQSRTLVFIRFNWNLHFKNHWKIVLVSFLIGIISHVFWDSFTHKDGYFVNQIDFLRNTLSIRNTEVPFWKIAQHLSTLIGAIIIILVFIKLPKKEFVPGVVTNKLYWITVFLFTSSILFIRFILNPEALSIGNLIVSIIASFIISITLIPIIIKSKSDIRNW